MDSVNSKQLELALYDVRSRIPWSGRSPRELTRVAQSFIFKPGGAKSVRELLDPLQLEFWPSEDKGPHRYDGAPLLIPFKGG